MKSQKVPHDMDITNTTGMPHLPACSTDKMLPAGLLFPSGTIRKIQVFNPDRDPVSY